MAPGASTRLALYVAVALALSCSAVETVLAGGGAAEGGAGGAGAEGASTLCDDGAICLADEVCGYDPSLGCGAARICASKEGYPTCGEGWRVCSCEEVSKNIGVSCNSGTTEIPSTSDSYCGPSRPLC